MEGKVAAEEPAVLMVAAEGVGSRSYMNNFVSPNSSVGISRHLWR